MGTVLSFSPRERRPVYSTHHHSGGLSSSSSSDFQLNNYSYEQLNNVKNRENINLHHQTVPNNSIINTNNINNNNSSSNVVLNLSGGHHQSNNAINNNNNNNTLNNSTQNSTLGSNQSTNSSSTTAANNNNTINNNSTINNNNSSSNTDTARILSEKNALEKNLKKHSLFINALSWKRLAASHGKKKLENNKNKAANLPTAAQFRPPLADAIHPLVVDKNKNIQQVTQQQVFFTPGAPKALLALDLVRANNTNSLQPQDKLAPKLPLSLPLPLQTALSSQPQQQHTHGPRKTVIQVCFYLSVLIP